MKIVYHHRTRATDAQRVHILEMVHAFRRLGHEVAIVSLVDVERPQDASREAGEAPWKKIVRKVPYAYEIIQLGYNLLGIPLLLRKVISWNPDFLYERYSLFNFSGVLIAYITKKPLILEVNSPFYLEQKSDRDIRALRLAAWMERRICRAASKVIVVSNPLKRIMVELGVPIDRLIVMSNGINPDEMRMVDESEPLRRQLGISGKVVIGFVGWFKKWHGLEYLLQSFQESGLSAQNAAVLLIGDGPAMSDLRRFVAANGLQHSVVFTGALPHDEVPRYLNAIDIAVQPAANEYCCPMKILEYMGIGKPLVAPRQENITELVRDGVDAELFTPGDKGDLTRALVSMVTQSGRRASMGIAARQVIFDRGYLWTSNAQRVIDLAEVARTMESGDVDGGQRRDTRTSGR